jgi:cell wall-associated NlpC family hydrolase
MDRQTNKNNRFSVYVFITVLAGLVFAGDVLNAAGITFFPGPDAAYAPEIKAVVARNTPVAIIPDAKNATIYFTTDGSAPTIASMKYTGPVIITSDTTIKAAAMKSGGALYPYSSMRYSVYSSPYDISSIISEPSLSADFTIRDSQLATEPAKKDWYRKSAYSIPHIFWGPKAKQFPGIGNRDDADAQWMRRRIIAAAARYINAQYQYHRLIMWDPSQAWPMNPILPVRLGHQSQGTDCSSFTSWVYNFAFGIEFSGYIAKQARMSTVKMPDGSTSKVETISGKLFKPDFNKLTSKLKTGDLIFSKKSGKGGKPDHVAIWIGKDAKTGDWLIIDSHDTITDSMDASGGFIPTGVQIRAFRENSWYYKGFIKSVRIIKDVN